MSVYSIYTTQKMPIIVRIGHFVAKILQGYYNMLNTF